MYCSVLSATVSGMEMIPVQVEADVSDGMPQFTMVGYVSAQVKEAQDRVRTALKNMGIPCRRNELRLIYPRRTSEKKDRVSIFRLQRAF